MSRFDLLNENEELMFESANYFEPYPNEKIRMKLHTGEKREQLKESIIRNGILTPVIAMPSNNKGKLVCLAGWNRISICSELNIQVLYQLKTNLTEEQADAICIDTNLLNRQHNEFLISELAHIINRKFEILNHQGKNNTTSRNYCTKLLEDIKISRRTAQYYIRLTFLSDELLKMVDDKKIKFVSAVAISYLKENEQHDLAEYILLKNYIITPKVANELKRLSQESDMNIDIKSILDNITTKTNISHKLSKKTLKEIYDQIPNEDIENVDTIILEAVKSYYKNIKK